MKPESRRRVGLAASLAVGLAVVAIATTLLREPSEPSLEEIPLTEHATGLGVEWHATPAEFRDQCLDAAEGVGFSVPCPAWLPKQPSLLTVRCPPDGCAADGVFLLDWEHFLHPETRHLILRAAPAPADSCDPR